MSLDDEWEKFNLEDDNADETDLEMFNSMTSKCNMDVDAPTSGDIHISTKSKIAYLNNHINLIDVFWKIKITPYYIPKDGVIKKQMKFNSKTKEELEEIERRLQDEHYHNVEIITKIDNPEGRIKFKDIRKINVGICKKDITCYKLKKKSAFYNCFVMFVRLYFPEEDEFKDFHVKIFNTGKVEIPGIQSDEVFNRLLQKNIDILQPFVEEKLEYSRDSDTILINSNFNCGFFINRESLFNILRYKYNVQCIYDPCSYPGVQCKFYYDINKNAQISEQINKKDKRKFPNLVSVSYMIFRTGSVLIVGKCNEDVLYIVYNYIRNLLIEEFHNISINVIENAVVKVKKNRRRNIKVSSICHDK